mgnify:FL=1
MRNIKQTEHLENIKKNGRIESNKFIFGIQFT